MSKTLIYISATLGLLLPSSGTASLRGEKETKGVEKTPPAEAAFEKEFNDPALKERLKDSTWEFESGKRFILHADGSTTGSWHATKGVWRIIGKNKVQLTVTWRPEAPATVSVESDGSILRWSDEDWGHLAKRVGGGASASNR